MHRASYWKTTTITLLGAVLALSALSWVTSVDGSRGSLLAAGIVLLALLVVALGFIAAGGIVCLWRDAREGSGKPDILAALNVRTPQGGWVSRAGFRFLLGPALRPGDVVIVRPQREIEASLDAARTLDGLPYMDEMNEYCGRIFRVHRRVDKINDMRNKTGLRRVRDTVTLSGLRCSGSHHDGCQAECQILWKDSWLRRLPGQAIAPHSGAGNNPRLPVESGKAGGENRTYVCQMTELWEASRPMSSFDLRQDLRPLFWGNVAIRAYLIAILTQIFNKVQRLRGGADYPFIPEGKIAGGTPVANSELKAGEAVIVRKKHEIAETLVGGKNRGLWFDPPEMVRFCGQSAVVRKRVDRVIHEATRKMVLMKTPSIMLENVVATGEFLRQCPQHDYIFWREIWLRRLGQDSATVAVVSDR